MRTVPPPAAAAAIIALLIAAWFVRAAPFDTAPYVVMSKNGPLGAGRTVTPLPVATGIWAVAPPRATSKKPLASSNTRGTISQRHEPGEPGPVAGFFPIPYILASFKTHTYTPLLFSFGQSNASQIRIDLILSRFLQASMALAMLPVRSIMLNR